MNIDKIPDYILADLRERELSDKCIQEATPEMLFHEYCMWQGLMGWGFTLIKAIDDLREANK